VPRFDTAFNFGALARPKAPAAKPKGTERPKGAKPKGKASFGASHGS
jgi:hypothetical protein